MNGLQLLLSGLQAMFEKHNKVKKCRCKACLKLRKSGDFK